MNSSHIFKKPSTWLWILGWLLLFPVPLTILMLRNQKLDKKVRIGIIAIAWIVFFIIALAGNTSDSHDIDVDETSLVSHSENRVTSNIKNLSFSRNDNVQVNIGEVLDNGWLHVTANTDFSPEDIIFVSDNPEIATISFTEQALTSYLYYEITGMGVGETEVYATSKDGSIVSERILVTVSNPIEELVVQNKSVTVKIGETIDTEYLEVELSANSDFSPEHVIFVSENPEIATISFLKDSFTNRLYYEITGVEVGETDVYATSKDGSVVSERIHVTVPTPIQIEEILIEKSIGELASNQTTKLLLSILPENAEDRRIVWTSSDENVAVVNENGTVTPIGDGTVTITATSANGIQASTEITVNTSKHLYSLYTSYSRQNDNNIGDEWSYATEVNGEDSLNDISLSVGDTLSLYTRISEHDDNPDIGEVSTVYTVSEDDFTNGFVITKDLYVTENGGKNSGQSVHFVVTYEFTPK